MNSERVPGPRLPDDPTYWENLAERSVRAALGSSAAAGMPRTHRAAPDAWWRGLADGAYVLAASAVLALLGASLLLGERSLAPMDAQAFTQLHLLAEPHMLTAALTPADPMIATLLEAPAGAPSASVLLRLVALREEAR
jgi:hypothetical protein